MQKKKIQVASGLISTTYQIDSALGLAITIAIASIHTETLTMQVKQILSSKQ